MTLTIYNFDDGEIFTFNSLKKTFPYLNRKRFHDIIKIFVQLNFVNKIGRIYKRIINVEPKIKI